MTEWFATLGAIVAADILLAGNNAMLVGMAVAKLPKEQRLKAVATTAIFAMLLTASMALTATYLMQIPGVIAVAGGALFALGAKTAYDSFYGHGQEIVAPEGSFVKIVLGILVANALCSIENSFAIAALAHGDLSLIAAGVFISVSIIMFGSGGVVALLQRFPRLPILGGTMLAGLGIYMIMKGI